MKVALFLFGLSYKKEHNHWVGKTKTIDFRKSVINYKHFIFGLFSSIDVYYATNELDEDMKRELEETYHPKKCIYMDFEQDKTIYKKDFCRNKRFIESLNLCDEEYDYCMVTRFDLLFSEKFKFDFDKLNLVSELEIPNSICDNFYFMPFSMFHEFRKICIKNKDKSFHFIKDEFKFPIHFLRNEKSFVTDLTYYKIFHTLI